MGYCSSQNPINSQLEPIRIIFSIPLVAHIYPVLRTQPMKTQNLISQLADTVKTQSALSASWSIIQKPEINPPCKLNWTEQGQSCQATYTDELGTVELEIKKEAQNQSRDVHRYRLSYQYRSPDGNLIAEGIWEPSDTITQAKQLAEYQLGQFL